MWYYPITITGDLTVIGRPSVTSINNIYDRGYGGRHFEVPGKPVALQRPRFVKSRGVVYDPSKKDKIKRHNNKHEFVATYKVMTDDYASSARNDLAKQQTA